jgi:hypothetical protein
LWIDANTDVKPLPLHHRLSPYTCFCNTMKLTASFKSCPIHELELFRRQMHKPESPMRSFFNAMDSQPPQLKDCLVAREIVTLLTIIDALSSQMYWTLLICSLVEASKQTWLPRELSQPKFLRCTTLKSILVMHPYSFPMRCTVGNILT